MLWLFLIHVYPVNARGEERRGEEESLQMASTLLFLALFVLDFIAFALALQAEHMRSTVSPLSIVRLSIFLSLCLPNEFSFFILVKSTRWAMAKMTIASNCNLCKG